MPTTDCRFEIQARQLYQEQGVYRNQPDEVMLHDVCPERLACWGGESNIAGHGNTWNRIQKPYVGADYSGGLLVVALNLHNYGGWGCLDGLFLGEEKSSGVIEYLRQGKKKIDFADKNYRGTILFHRIAVYSSILAFPRFSGQFGYAASAALL